MRVCLGSSIKMSFPDRLHEVPITLEEFADGEKRVQINESIRGEDIFIVQSFTPPAGDKYWVELLLIIDAFKRASAGNIILVVPYLGYARQDRKNEPRVPISSRVVANTLEGQGIDRLITLDLHSSQIQGFYNIPVDNLYGSDILMQYYGEKDLRDPVVVSPDLGRSKIAQSFASYLGGDVAIASKMRGKANEVKRAEFVCNTVIEDRDVIICDDIIDTGGTLKKCLGILRPQNPSRIYISATHGLFSSPIKLLSLDIEEMTVTNTVSNYLELERLRLPFKLEVVDIKDMLTTVIEKTYTNESLSELFLYNK